MRILDFFFALRPLVLVPAWSFFLLGAAAAGALQPFPATRLIALTLVLIGGYMVNQVVDFETDRLNGKGLFLQRGLFSRRTYLVAAAVCTAGGVVVALAAREAPVRIATAAALVLAYSIPPLRLSSRAGFDLVANAAGYGVLAPWTGAGESALPTGFGIAGALAVGAVFVHTTLLDLPGDRTTGKRTLGVVLPAGVARGVAVALAAPTPLLLHAAGWPVAGAAGTTALLCLAAAVAPAHCASRTVCVAATAAFALAAAVAWPPFGPALAGLVVGTRLYYRRRFGLTYPAA